MRNKENIVKAEEKSLDPQLIRMLKEGTEVIFPRFKIEKPQITDFVGSKMENFSDVLDVRIGIYKLSRSWYTIKSQFRSNVAIQKVFCECLCQSGGRSRKQ